MKNAKLIFFLLLISASLSAQNIRVVSYNIRYNNSQDGLNQWPLRYGKIDTLLNEIRGDVYCFQEVLNDQLNTLSLLLPGYSYVGVGRDDGITKGEYSPIFYDTAKYELLFSGTFWLSPKSNEIGSIGWDAAITRICTYVQLKQKKDAKVFWIFNTHFDHVGEKARSESAQLIVAKIGDLVGKEAVIVAGDFNSEPNSGAYQSIINNKYHPLKDSYLDQPNSYMCTFTGFAVNSGICKRIDFIFYDNKFKLKSFKINTRNNGTFYPSDHLPIYADFKF